VHLVQQIREAHEKRGWSVQQLLDKSGLPIDRSTLHRKLKGDVASTTIEIEALATALEITITWPKRHRSRR
jgi:ribosome-binding protein aMBF1 (putative translation factor)